MGHSGIIGKTKSIYNRFTVERWLLYACTCMMPMCIATTHYGRSISLNKLCKIKVRPGLWIYSLS